MKKMIFLIFLCFTTVCFADKADTVIDGYFQTSENQSAFNDLQSVPWANEAINYLAKYNVVSGEGKFYPNNNITREEFTKILVLAFGMYDETATSDFTDSNKDDWHYGYISSANKLGITNGISRVEFGVGKNIERQEIAALIFRMIQKVNESTNELVDTSFNDNDRIDDYAKDAIAFLQKEQIISGDDYNNFNPTQYATRAEACKIIYLSIKK